MKLGFSYLWNTIKRHKKIAKGVLIGASLLTIGSSLYIVDQTQQAVVTRFGNPKRVIMNPIKKDEQTESIIAGYRDAKIRVSEGPGLYVKWPFIERARKFDRRLLRWDGYPEEINTKDKKYLFIDPSVRYYIGDPLKFLKKVGSEYGAHARLDDVGDSRTRNVLTNKDLIDIVRSSNRQMRVSEKELEATVLVGEAQEGREKIAQEICKGIIEDCEQYGIKIHPKGFMLRGVIYVDSVKEKVEERMISERTRVASRYTSEGAAEYQKIMGDKEKELKTIMSDAYKQSQEIKGAAEAEALTIYADAYNKDPAFYKFLKTLEVYEKGLTPGTKVVIGTDNPLFGLIKGDTEIAVQK